MVFRPFGSSDELDADHSSNQARSRPAGIALHVRRF
jgi:hypothetical protein